MQRSGSSFFMQDPELLSRALGRRSGLFTLGRRLFTGRLALMVVIVRRLNSDLGHVVARRVSDPQNLLEDLPVLIF